MKLAPVLTAIIMAGVLARAQSSTGEPPAVTLPKRLHIRAILENTVDTNKAKVGDSVQMRALAEEMDGTTLLIAKNARLFGKVTEVVPLASPNSEARLMIIIERAEWRKHSVPLHAFIVAQGILKTKTVMRDYRCKPYEVKGEFGLNIDCTDEDKLTSQTVIDLKSSPPIRGVELRHIAGPESPTVFISKAANIVLRSDTVVLLRNTIP